MDHDDDIKISVEATDEALAVRISSENETHHQLQRRTFSHWSYPCEFIEQMVNAGFYGCNVNDCTICLQCNLVAKGWIPGIDDPCGVHRIISPNCRYVQSKLMGLTSLPPPASLLPILNANLSQTLNVAEPHTFPQPVNNSFNYDEIVPLKRACNHQYAEIPARVKSFDNWPNTNSPSIDDLVRAGFFYNGVNDIVTCFYCNGTLHRWRANADPMIEHARCFPNCAYARQLCDYQLFQRIQALTCLQRGQFMVNKTNENNLKRRSSTNTLTINRLLSISNEETLTRLVVARLDLPMSQILKREFSLAIIERCWNDQLRIKEEDFISEEDLRVACRIQEQMDIIGRSGEDIIIPSVVMGEYEQSLSYESDDLSTLERIATITETENLSNNSMSLKICLHCRTDVAHLACIPCGHLVTCDPCRRFLALCPTCQREIKAFIRVYI